MKLKVSNIQARVSLDPIFDTLNNYYQQWEDEPEPDEAVIKASDEWENCPETMCDECLLGKYQRWIWKLNLRDVPESDLCTLIYQLKYGQIKSLRDVDIMDTGGRMPGSAFSNG